MKHILSSTLFILIAISLNAQRYNTAAGLRLTRGAGLSIAQRIADQWTVEGIAMTNFQGNSDLVALGRYHGKIAFQKRFNWYAGAGLHTGRTNQANTFGAAFVGGVEFSMQRINVSLDYMPLINFQGGSFWDGNPGISVRYVLVKRPKKTVKDKLKDKRDNWKKNRGKKKKENKGGLKGKIFNN